MEGLTFDTGALLALERGRQRMAQVMRAATRRDLRITAPAAAVAEWWRGRTDLRAAILEAIEIEPMDDELAKRAGEALAAVRSVTVVDAIVMASAARRGDVVYTSDIGDLERLRRHFRAVPRVLGVG